MRSILKALGWLALFALFFMILHDPEQAAQTVVSVGLTIAEVAIKVGTFFAWIADKLPVGTPAP